MTIPQTWHIRHCPFLSLQDTQEFISSYRSHSLPQNTHMHTAVIASWCHQYLFYHLSNLSFWQEKKKNAGEEDFQEVSLVSATFCCWPGSLKNSVKVVIKQVQSHNMTTSQEVIYMEQITKLWQQRLQSLQDLLGRGEKHSVRDLILTSLSSSKTGRVVTLAPSDGVIICWQQECSCQQEAHLLS